MSSTPSSVAPLPISSAWLSVVGAVIAESGVSDISPVDFALNISLIKAWADKRRQEGSLLGSPILTTESIPPPQSVVHTLQETYKLCKLAMAPYANLGSALYHLLHDETPPASPLDAVLASPVLASERSMMARIAGVPIDNVLYISDAAVITCPRYAIFRIDPAEGSTETGKIVLSVRGTIELADVVTDALAKSTAFAFGTSAHAGIAESARNLFLSAEKRLLDILTAYPTYELSITGHSLGAGTAILLTTLVIESQLNNRSSETRTALHTVPVHCVAFAPPPVLSHTAALPREVTETCTSWVNRHDIVPRLSVKAVKDLIHLCHKINRLHPHVSARVFGTEDISDAFIGEDAWIHSLLWQAPKEGLDSFDVWDRLVIPGRILTIQGSKPFIPRNHVQRTIADAKDAVISAYETSLAKVTSAAAGFWKSVSSFAPGAKPEAVPAPVGEGAGAMPEEPSLLAAPTHAPSPLELEYTRWRTGFSPASHPHPIPSALTAAEPAPTKHSAGGRVLVAEADNEDLWCISVHDSAVEDHLPDSYLSVFRDIISQLNYGNSV